MPYVAPEVVQRVKQIDLLTYLKNYEPYELVHFSGNVYTTRSHDSLKISTLIYLICVLRYTINRIGKIRQNKIRYKGIMTDTLPSIFPPI